MAGIVDPASHDISYWDEADAAAKRHDIRLYYVEAGAQSDLPRAFSTIVDGRARALMIFGSPSLWASRVQIAQFARKHSLPTIYMYREGPESGGLMSYGTSLTESWRRAANYVDQILKGAKPANLPVEQPTTFEFVINVKIAKALGLTIPPSLLARADHLIE